jgi:hypothetical protein
MRKRWIFIAPLALVAMALFVFVGGELVMRLWNWLLPPLFGWRAITFWQALGMLVLCRILFGGSGWRGSGGWRVRRRMRERWGTMTPEERERFRQRMSARWGFGPPGREGGSHSPPNAST